MNLLDSFLYFLGSYPATARFSQRRPLIGGLILVALIAVIIKAYMSWSSLTPEEKPSVFGLIIIFGLLGSYSLALAIGLKNRLTGGPSGAES